MGRGSDVVVGVDLGTTSSKAVAFTADGTAVAAGQVGYRLRSRRPGHAEQDADEVRNGALEATAEAVAAAVGAGHAVVALSFSAAMHSLIGVNAAGLPLTPVLTWADNRAAEQAARLRGQPLGLELHRRTGTPVHPMSPLLKLRWFAEQQPEVAALVAHWVGIKEYLLARLTDRWVVDHGIASATGMFDLAGLAWDGAALDHAGVTDEQLPEPVPTTAVLPLGREGASLLGLPAGTPLVVGGSDGPLANLGLGAVRPGDVACSIGTSGAVRVVTDRPIVDERGRVFCYVLAPGRYVVGGAVNNGGLVLEWLGEAVAPDLAGPPALLDLAAAVPAGCGGLLFLPQLMGERAPRWSGDPRGVYLGLTREHRREHLLRAGLEGVCLQLALVLASMADAQIEIRDIRATGGFSRSPLWRRILAATFGRPVGFAASPEGSCLGAALLGMSALGLLGSLDAAADIVAVTERTTPDPAEVRAYSRLLPVFDRAADALVPVFGRIADLAGELPLR